METFGTPCFEGRDDLARQLARPEQRDPVLRRHPRRHLPRGHGLDDRLGIGLDHRDVFEVERADAVAAMATQAVFGDERADDGMIPGGVALACVRIARVAAVRGVGRRIGARVPVRGRRAPVVAARDEKEGEEATEGAKVETRHGRSLGWRSVRVVHYPIGRLSQSSPPFWGRLVAVCYCRVAR